MGQIMNVSRTRSAMKCSSQVGLDFGTGMKWFKEMAFSLIFKE
jgi:hypothetical protein